MCLDLLWKIGFLFNAIADLLSHLPFDYSILLRRVSCCQLMLNFMLLKESFECEIFLSCLFGVLLFCTHFASRLNILKASQAFDLCVKKYTHLFLLKSQVKVIKYMLPLDVGISTQHKFEWTISSNFLALQNFLVGNEFLCFFPISHVSHTTLGTFTTGKLKTSFFLIDNLTPKSEISQSTYAITCHHLE